MTSPQSTDPRKSRWQLILARILSGASPFVALPLVIHVGGQQGWVAISVGQALGSVAAVAIQSQWQLYGPRLAAQSLMHPRQLAFASLKDRFKSLVVYTFLAAMVALTVFRDFPSLLMLLSLFAAAVNGLNLGWLFIGRGAFRYYFFFEGVARFAASLLSVGLLASGCSIMTYPLSQVLPAVLWLVFSRRPEQDLDCSSIRHKGLGATQFLQAIYVTLPLVFVSRLLSMEAATFSTYDRLSKLSLAGMLPFVQMPQSRMAATPSSLRLSVARHELKNTLFWAVVYTVCFGSASAVYVTVWLSGSIQPSNRLLLLFSLLGGVVVLNRSLISVVLTGLDLRTAIMQSIRISIAIGLLTLFPAIKFLGADGAVGSMLLAELGTSFWAFRAFRNATRESKAC